MTLQVPNDVEPPKKYPRPSGFKPELLFPVGHVWAGNKRCWGWNDNEGRQCGRLPRIGRNFCPRHGGNVAVGVAAPGWKTGRHSKYMPSCLLEKFNEAQSDPELLELNAEIHVIDSMLDDAIESLDQDGITSIWRNLKGAANEYKTQKSRGDEAEAGRVIDILLALIWEGSSEKDKRESVLQLIDERRKVVESQRKRYLELQQYKTVEEVLAMQAAMISIIARLVADRDLRVQIAREMERVLRG